MRRIVLFALLLATALAACGYRVRVGEHDAGPVVGCSADSDCTPGNQCYCGHCISLDVLPGACDPPCGMARPGDYCHDEGRRCDLSDGCGSFVECTGGVFVGHYGACDGGPPCECPMPPPGCRYVGFPCPCSEIECDPPRCGRVLCPMGTYCCNESCSQCVPEGGTCTDLVCPPDCRPMEAYGEGGCELTHGYAWDGTRCAPVTGCSCVGAECGSIFPTLEGCEAAFTSCLRACGGFAGLTCDPMGEICDYADPQWCGAPDASGVCRSRPFACAPTGVEVCGCDGRTYPSPCDAHAAGVDDAFEGRCEDCAPDDARATGLCGSVYGWAWTGTDCAVLSCACEGVDCMRVAGRDEASCRRLHAFCPVPAGP